MQGSLSLSDIFAAIKNKELEQNASTFKSVSIFMVL